MILTMVDAENRLSLYKYNGNGLEQLGNLRVVTDEPLELAQIAATLALMAGEENGHEPKERKKVAKAEPKVLPPAPKAAHKFNPDYAPDLYSVSGKILITLETAERALTAREVSERIGSSRPESDSATISAMANKLKLATSEPIQVDPENKRKVNHYTITQHGRDSLARARALET